MSKTKIEWCDYTINPVKGLCPMACNYCYARRMYKRFKWNPELRFEPAYHELDKKKPGRVFVGSTMELFGDWIDPVWMNMTMAGVLARPKFSFIFLTKKPENLIKWSPFPDNCWVGVSVTNRYQAHLAHSWLQNIEAKVKFVSIEPILDDVMQATYFRGLIQFHLNWLIIGQQTPSSPKTQPKIEWIREIVEAADKAGIPVFLKDNLKPIFSGINDRVPNILKTWWGEGNCLGTVLRQEFPIVR